MCFSVHPFRTFTFKTSILLPEALNFFSPSFQTANKKGGAVKSAGTKKEDGGAQAKTSKLVEPEDVEVNN